MTILYGNNSSFKPYKPMKTDHNSTTTMMNMNSSSTATSSSPLQLFPVEPSFLGKEGDFRGKKPDQRIKQDYGFTDLELGLGRNPSKDLRLIQKYPPPPPPSAVLGRQNINPDSVSTKTIREHSQLSSQTNQKLKRDYQEMATTSKQTFSYHQNDKQETLSSPMEMETSSTLAHEEGEIQEERSSFLFEKLVMKNDISDFNRLLVPVKCAVHFFPRLQFISNIWQYKPEMLKIIDNQNCKWDIMYEYWARSKSYVLTKGWKTFVTHHKLQFNDIIRVYKLADGFKRYRIEFLRPMKMTRLFGKDIYADYRKVDGIGFVGDERGEGSNECRSN